MLILKKNKKTQPFQSDSNLLSSSVQLIIYDTAYMTE